MIEYLKIKNIALIDELEVNFSFGLNILSGETGAGKSIIIDSINFVLGERTSKELIRSGEQEASVELLVSIKDDMTIQRVIEMGISVEDDNSIILFRYMNQNGKSLCRINGKVVTVGMLKEVSSLLVDIHGQHEHQSLLNTSRHIDLLDYFCDKQIIDFKAQLLEKYRAFRKVLKKIEELSGNGNDRHSRIELYQYQINEISAAKLKTTEETDLLERKKVLLHSEKLSKSASRIAMLLEGNGNDNAVVQGLSSILTEMNTIATIDSTQGDLLSLIDSIATNLHEFQRDFSAYWESLEYDSQEMQQLEERLDLIYLLKKKYGASVEDILNYQNDISQKCSILVNAEKTIEELAKMKASLKKEAVLLCEKISVVRKNAVSVLEKEITNCLHDLGMEDAQFLIAMDKKDEFNPNGYDKVEFQISPNKGEDLKPLSKIASGGEMSRVMLALKSVLADFDTIETFIFDEIDTGVSGRTAQQVAMKMSRLAKHHQILCITHLPQIASMSDSHYLIRKESDNNNRTITDVFPLDENMSVSEIARLIGGVTITNVTLEAAKEMIIQAREVKEGLVP